MGNVTIVLAIFVCIVAVCLATGRHSLPNSMLPIVKYERSIQTIHRMWSRRGVRTKRDVSMMTGLRCMNACMRIMLRDMRNLGIEGDDTGGALMNKDLLQGDTFEQYCDINQEGKDCLDRCELPASLKTGLSMAFSASEYVCVDHYDEFREHLACYRRADSEMERTCTPKCGDPQKILQRTQTEMQNALRTFSLSRVKKLLEDQCSFLRCNVKCHTPILLRHCSSRRAAELLNNMAAVTLRKAQNLVESVPFGRNYWPRTCRRIAEQGFPTVTNRVENTIDNNEESAENVEHFVL